MRLFFIISCLTCFIGCTSLKHIEASPVEIQQMIVHENFLQVGEHVKVTTKSGSTEEFEIINIDNKSIAGKGISIKVEDIVAVEKRELSVGKTATLVGGAYALYVIALILAAPALILSGG